MLSNRASGRKVVLAVVLSFMLMGSYAVADPLQNGDFSTPLDPAWDYLGGVSYDDVDQVAVMEWDAFSYPWDYPKLGQAFTIPNLDVALTFSFDYKPNNVEAGSSFVAGLCDPLDPDIPYTPIIPDAAYLDGEFFAHDWLSEWDSTIVDYVSVESVWDDYVTVKDLGDGWSNVSLDLSPIRGSTTNAYIVFDFFNSFETEQILIDNVRVVPVFSSVLLGVMGLGTAATVLRRKNSFRGTDGQDRKC